MTTHSGNMGVFYHGDDYISVSRRLAIDFIDTFLTTVACGACSLALMILWPHDASLGPIILALWVAVWFLYFVILKRSTFRTIGYKVFGARVVNLQGQRPGILSLLGRILFVVGGPANVLIDLLWIPSDPCRQAIRDKFAHTYVIRRDAQPIGVGRIVYRTYSMFGTTFLFQEVQSESPITPSRP